MPDEKGKLLVERLSWEFDGVFAHRALEYLADRYIQQGAHVTTANCIRSGMPVDHESHVVLTAITEFLASLTAAGFVIVPAKSQLLEKGRERDVVEPVGKK